MYFFVCVYVPESEGTLILPIVESSHGLRDDDAVTITSDDSFFSAAEVEKNSRAHSHTRTHLLSYTTPIHIAHNLFLFSDFSHVKHKTRVCSFVHFWKSGVKYKKRCIHSQRRPGCSSEINTNVGDHRFVFNQTDV